ncbi:MAG TPA: hypothetical protein VIU64_16440 [Polyangia bacterium]
MSGLSGLLLEMARGFDDADQVNAGPWHHEARPHRGVSGEMSTFRAWWVPA